MTKDEQEIHELTLRWLDCWTISDDRPWDAENFRDLQVADEVLVTDDFGGTLYVFTGNDGYRDVWGPLVKGLMKEWKIGPEGPIKIRTDGDLAYSSFVLVGGGKLKSGEPEKLRQYCTFVWERRDGRWGMIIEHISTDHTHT